MEGGWGTCPFRRLMGYISTHSCVSAPDTHVRKSSGYLPRSVPLYIRVVVGSGHTSALQLANEHRNAYGLRYNDFQRYRYVLWPRLARWLIRTRHRKHCANRTHRLRSTLKMTHGKGRNFQQLPTLTKEIVKDGQYVLHLSSPYIDLNLDLILQPTTSPL